MEAVERHLRAARAVGRAARDRGRAGLDADRAAAAPTPPSARSRPPTASRSRGWAAAARSRSSPGCATPTRTRASSLWGAQDSDLARDPRRQRVGRPRRAGEDRAGRGAAARRARLIPPARRRSQSGGRETLSLAERHGNTGAALRTFRVPFAVVAANGECQLLLSVASACGRQAVEQRVRLRRGEQPRALRDRQEPLGDGVVEERGEPVVVAGDVEHAERLVVQPQLAPGVDLDQLLERPDPAGQRDERVRRARPSAPCARASSSRRAARSGRGGRSRGPRAPAGSRRRPRRRPRAWCRRARPSGRPTRRRRRRGGRARRACVASVCVAFR